jgi:hypothetical protein
MVEVSFDDLLNDLRSLKDIKGTITVKVKEDDSKRRLQRKRSHVFGGSGQFAGGGR